MCTLRPATRRRGVRDHLRRPAWRRRGQYQRGVRDAAGPPAHRVPPRRASASEEADAPGGGERRRTSSTTSRRTSSRRSAAPPSAADLPPPTRSVDDIQIQLERPSDRPAFADEVATRGRRLRPGARAAARDRRRHRGRGARMSAAGSSRPRPSTRRRSRRRTSSLRLLAEHGADTSGSTAARRSPRCAGRRSEPGEVLVARGRRPSFVYVPTGPGPGRPTGRRLRAVAAAAVGARRDDRRDPPRRAQQRDRRRAHGRRDHDPGRALRPGVAAPAHASTSSPRDCSRRSRPA